MRKLFFIFASLIAFINIKAQELDKIIELHRKNIDHLLMSRGAPPQWTSGTLSEEDIADFLSNYKQVGIIMYTYLDNALHVMYYTEKGKVFSNSYKIDKEELAHNMKLLNAYYSTPSNHNLNSNRGSKATSRNNSTKIQLKKITDIILPNREILADLDHIIIIPTLNIATVPFSALEFSDNTFLIDKMGYSIAPSLFELFVNKELGIKNKLHFNYSPNKYLLIANPSYPADKWNFQNLPGAENEANALKAILGEDNCTIYTKNEATITNILPEIDQYELIYFATHGISNTENPLDSSFLVLAQDKEGSYLTARAIQQLHLNANLVVLSACQTGLGKEHDGGVIGLARAFQIAGAKNVLSSLWNIDDKETVTIMTELFKNIYDNEDITHYEALRKAILQYKKEINSNPYFWSAFTLFGVPDE